MKKRIRICAVAALTTFAGALSLAAPAAAAPAGESAGCTLEEFSAAIRLAHDSCRSLGYDGGTVQSCEDGQGQGVCWHL